MIFENLKQYSWSHGCGLLNKFNASVCGMALAYTLFMTQSFRAYLMHHKCRHYTRFLLICAENGDIGIYQKLKRLMCVSLCENFQKSWPINVVAMISAIDLRRKI